MLRGTPAVTVRNIPGASSVHSLRPCVPERVTVELPDGGDVYSIHPQHRRLL